MTRTNVRGVALAAVTLALLCAPSARVADAQPVPDELAHEHAAPPRRLIPKGPRVMELDTFTFPVAIQADRMTFVEFYVHDCWGCRRVASQMDALAEAVEPWGDTVIARFDCEAGEVLCGRWDVDRTPSFLLFHNGTKVIQYKAEIYHVEMMLPFLTKMREKVLGKGAQGDARRGATSSSHVEL